MDELDAGIKDRVLLLRVYGFDTFTSCEGGDGHAFERPTIRIWPSSAGADVDECLIAGVLIRAGYGGFYIKRVNSYQLFPKPWKNMGGTFIEIEFWA